MPAPKVISVNTSSGGIPKRPVDVGVVRFSGLQGDGHNHEKHLGPLRAVTLLDIEDLDNLCREGFDVYPGATGENLTVRDLDSDALVAGDRLTFSGGVEIEITMPRRPCYVLDSIDPRLKGVFAGRCGCKAKVIREGEIRAGETIEVVRSGSRESAAIST